jgi:hypothetical protein
MSGHGRRHPRRREQQHRPHQQHAQDIGEALPKAPRLAAAHKLARLIHTLLTLAEEYTDQGQDHFEERYRQRALQQLTKRTGKLGMTLVPAEQPS